MWGRYNAESFELPILAQWTEIGLILNEMSHEYRSHGGDEVGVVEIDSRGS